MVRHHPLLTSPLTFWAQRHTLFNRIADFSEDLNAAAASQALVERIFSVCGMLTQDCRNRVAKFLEKRVCLKLNHKILADMYSPACLIVN